MKLGTETASLVNHLYSRATIGQSAPAIGMGATILCWSDRHAATITEVFMVGKTQYITVQHDHARRTDQNGMSEAQDYEYERNPAGRRHTFRLVKDEWQEVYKNHETGRWKKTNSSGLLIGRREKYRDFSF